VLRISPNSARVPVTKQTRRRWSRGDGIGEHIPLQKRTLLQRRSRAASKDAPHIGGGNPGAGPLDDQV
jgi:hypothetical protein